MNNPVDVKAARDHINVAMETSCDALIMLRSIYALADNQTRVEELAASAIESMRHLIEELRQASGRDHGGVTLGFVIGVDWVEPATRSLQSQPR